MPTPEPVRALDALWDDVAAWLRQAAVTDDDSGTRTRGSIDVDGVHEALTSLVADASSLGLVDVTNWSPQVVSDLAQRLAQRDPGRAVRQWAPLAAFLAYLGVSGRWSGTPGQFDAATQAATAAEAGFTDLAVQELPIVGHLHALLAWVGPRRPVTSTQSIRRGDLPDAARCVEVDLSSVRATSMGQIAHLPEVWTGLVGGGALDVAVTVATPSYLGLAWLAETPATAGQARLRALLAYLTVLLARPSLSTLCSPPGVMLAPLLHTAAVGNPITAAALEHAVDTSFLGAPPGVGGIDGRMFALGPLRGVVDQLARDGLLQRSPDGEASWTVAPGLERVAHAAPTMLEVPQLVTSTAPTRRRPSRTDRLSRGWAPTASRPPRTGPGLGN